MSTITTTISHRITLGTSGSYASPLTIAAGGAILSNTGTTGDPTADAVYGGPTLSTWLVVNDGLISSTGNSDADGIKLKAGGTVVNNGSINATDQGVVADSGAGLLTVVNTGTITGGNRGVEPEAGGVILNSTTSAVISSTQYGVFSGYYEPPKVLSGQLATVTNFGTIVATGTGGVGVDLGSGGTIINAGLISSGGAYAVVFGGTVSNLLVLEHGYSFTGKIHGSGSSGASNTLELLGTTVSNAVTVNYNGLSLSNFGTVAFTGTTADYATLKITSNAAPPRLIVGFDGPDDIIDLTAVGTNGTIAQNDTVNHRLTVTGSGGSVTLQFDATSATNFLLSSDHNTGTDVAVACFCRGTRILTGRGEVTVEDLAIGDKVTTASGALRPVKWIGRRSYDGRFVRGNAEVLPIRVRAAALADGVPRRDLYLSPQHALHLDGVLVPAGLLVNGASVERVAAPKRIDYFHIELDSHDLILAEGAAAESYVDCDNRGMFHNAAEFAALYPGEASERWAFCAERVEAGAKLAAVRESLAVRLPVLGWAMTEDPRLHLLVDGRVLLPEIAGGGLRIFRVAGPAREIRLASRAAAPAETGFGDDPRRLGVGLRRLVLRSASLRATVGFDDPSLGEGFYPPEAGHRWTDGDARLPQRLLDCFEGPFTVEIEAGALSCYPVYEPIAGAVPGPAA